jgi:hypothetical protein
MIHVAVLIACPLPSPDLSVTRVQDGATPVPEAALVISAGYAVR